MVGSLWRYSHILLAIISALFLVIASITGAILALEPIAVTAQPYAVVPLDTVQLSETVAALKERYSEVLELEITPEDFVKASVFTLEGKSETIYVHPLTGAKLGDVKPQSSFFNLVTNVHRSLFLKSLGRAFVGIVSFLLCFIAVTGVFLLAQRQGGFKKWFSKVKETDFGQRYHVILGRWFLIPVLIIATTGVYLSAEKFSLLPENKITHNWSSIASEISTNETDVKYVTFQQKTLDQIRKLIFPFSEDSEDYYQLSLHKSEVLIHQYSGAIVSEVEYPFVQLVSRWSMQWHTGQGSVAWSVILLLSSLSLLFFMFSGFILRYKNAKKNKKINSKWNKDEAEFILLVGSETGSTSVFAKAFYNALTKKGKRVFVSSLNEYSRYEKATHIIVFTATYGDGDAPSNARNFETLLHKIKPANNLKFSVIGFGSLLYPKYCRFAVYIDGLLHHHHSFFPVLPLFKINEQSDTAFKSYIKNWNDSMGLNLKVHLTEAPKKRIKRKLFKVIEKTSVNEDKTVVLTLRPLNKTKFQSGDLLNVYTLKDEAPRQYSIAKIKGDILLSVKEHDHGICSKYLCTIDTGSTISASIEVNNNFHFPKKAPSVWCVANGTGIAPFIGMINENNSIPTQLIWGGRTADSFTCYEKFLKNNNNNHTFSYQLALSQVAEKLYVQDALLKRQDEVAKALKEGAVFMLCGSIAMQQAVLNILEQITQTHLQQPLSDFENDQQLLMDCY